MKLTAEQTNAAIQISLHRYAFELDTPEHRQVISDLVSRMSKEHYADGEYSYPECADGTTAWSTISVTRDAITIRFNTDLSAGEANG